jgi:D-alanyl-D-alanine carboxypeptidase
LNTSKKWARRGISLLFAVLMMLSALSLTVSAGDAPTPPSDLDGRAVCLYDLTHSKLIVGTNMNEMLNTSTSAKVLMGLIACEMLSDKLDDVVEINEEMIGGVSGYSMKLTVGERVSVRDLLYGAICASYNDAAYALAYICSGSISSFVEEMNQYAASLGAKSTTYINPIGFPDNSAMLTTLSDTLCIAIAAAQNELYMEICSAVKYQMSATNVRDGRTVYNRNYLISSHSTDQYYDPNCRGMNAGISGEAGGWSIITLIEDDGAQYICIVLGGTENEDASRIYAYETVKKLSRWARSTYNKFQVFKKGQILGQVKIELTALGSSKVDYVVSEDTYVYIPDHSNPTVTYEVEFYEELLRAPIKADTPIGVARIYCNGELSGSCTVTLAEDQESNAVMLIIDKIGQYTKSRAFIAAIICFAVLTVIFLIYNRKRNYFGGKYKRKF